MRAGAFEQHGCMLACETQGNRQSRRAASSLLLRLACFDGMPWHSGSKTPRHTLRTASPPPPAHIASHCCPGVRHLAVCCCDPNRRHHLCCCNPNTGNPAGGTRHPKAPEGTIRPNQTPASEHPAPLRCAAAPLQGQRAVKLTIGHRPSHPRRWRRPCEHQVTSSA